MKLATFDAGAGPQLGAVSADRIVPLHRAAPGLPGDMIGLISIWPAAEEEVRCIAEAGVGALPLDHQVLAGETDVIRIAEIVGGSASERDAPAVQGHNLTGFMRSVNDNLSQRRGRRGCGVHA